MAVREAVKIIEDAMRANLQAKLSALSVTSGEAAPRIAAIRDEFNDTSLAPADYPAVRVTSSPEITPQARFESMGRVQVWVPMEVVYTDRAGDTEKARQRASYFARAATQVLNDVIAGASASRVENGVMLINLVDLAYDYGLDTLATDHAALALLFTAHMEDTSP